MSKLQTLRWKYQYHKAESDRLLRQWPIQEHRPIAINQVLNAHLQAEMILHDKLSAKHPRNCDKNLLIQLK